MPTLVMRRVDDPSAKIEPSRCLVEHIEGAKYVELPGCDHMRPRGEFRECQLSEIPKTAEGRVLPNVPRPATTVCCDTPDVRCTPAVLLAELGR